MCRHLAFQWVCPSLMPLRPPPPYTYHHSFLHNVIDQKLVNKQDWGLSHLTPDPWLIYSVTLNHDCGMPKGKGGWDEESWASHRRSKAPQAINRKGEPGGGSARIFSALLRRKNSLEHKPQVWAIHCYPPPKFNSYSYRLCSRAAPQKALCWPAADTAAVPCHFLCQEMLPARWHSLSQPLMETVVLNWMIILS